MTLRGFLRGLVVFVAWEASDLYDWATHRHRAAVLIQRQAEQHARLWATRSDL